MSDETKGDLNLPEIFHDMDGSSHTAAFSSRPNLQEEIVGFGDTSVEAVKNLLEQCSQSLQQTEIAACRAWLRINAPPEKGVMTISNMIKQLEYVKNTYGDGKVVLVYDHSKGGAPSDTPENCTQDENIFFSSVGQPDGSFELWLQNFPY